MAFDSIQVRFKNIKEWPSQLTNTRTVPFVNSYLDVIKSCIDDIRTEYFWVFASFLKLDTFDFDFLPEQFEKDQIHVWYATHPMAGLNQEGNIMLVPTKQFKEQKNHYSTDMAMSELEDLLSANRLYKFKQATLDYIMKVTGRDYDSFNIRETGKFISELINELKERYEIKD